MGSTSLSIVEPVPGAAASRALPTTVWFPATSGSPGSVPDRSGGPYPLLVFSQGFDLSVQAYAALLEDLASAGFVVAAPTYPHTDPSDPSQLDEADIVNHPGDLRFVITTLLNVAGSTGSVLSGVIDENEVGILGHSDGGDVSLAVADNSCCRDPSVRAVAILSGAELSSFGGQYFPPGSLPPILVVQGSADTVNVPACSAQIYNAAEPPKYYLDLLGAEHEPPYTDPGVDLETVAKVTADFFDATLRGQSSALALMMAAGNVPGAAQITDSPSVPVPAGGCPGAPG